ncbi:MAG: M23 family metallopeptidase [Myxococcales bacterium]|nr:M23 family metallopeptidase [Myxococcales bacterium]
MVLFGALMGLAASAASQGEQTVHSETVVASAAGGAELPTPVIRMAPDAGHARPVEVAPPADAPAVEDRGEPQAPQRAPALARPAPLPEAPAPLAPADDGDTGSNPVVDVEGTLKPGQTVADLLGGHGVGLDEVNRVVAALRPHYDFRRARPGARYELRVTEGQVERFVFEHDPLEVFEAERQGEALVGKQLPVFLDTVEDEVACEIRSSLYEALERAGEGPALAAEVVGAFAWDIDFRDDPKAGDRFNVVVEKVYKKGTFIRYGRIVAAEYVGQVGTFRTFWFKPDKDTEGGYYLEDGQSARKTFLKTPLKFARVSSGFNLRRKHPVLGYTKAHTGVDYAAPRGTPVWAMADGTVTYAGWKGPNGRLVKIRHPDGLESAYAHLHLIAKGIQRGAKVKQGQVIGQVGTTGRSTGPHLHFAVKRNGKFLNPAKLKMTRGQQVRARDKKVFQAHVERLKQRLASIGHVRGEAP